MKLAKCPHCEALHADAVGVVASAERALITWPGGELHAPPSEVRVFASILRRGIALRANLVDDVYSNKIDGGPDQASLTIKVLVCKLRRRLREAGFPGSINTVHGSGYELSFAKEKASA